MEFTNGFSTHFLIGTMNLFLVGIDLDPFDQATPEEGSYHGNPIEWRKHRRQSQLGA